MSTLLWVEFTEMKYAITDPDPNDEWDSGSYGCSVEIHGLAHEKPEFGYDIASGHNFQSLDTPLNLLPGEIVYAVLVLYTDGDTFGSSGYWTIHELHRDLNDAVAAERKCYGNSNGYYRPWDGYFAHLDGTEVLEFETKRRFD